MRDERDRNRETEREREIDREREREREIDQMIMREYAVLFSCVHTLITCLFVCVYLCACFFILDIHQAGFITKILGCDDRSSCYSGKTTLNLSAKGQSKEFYFLHCLVF